MVKKISGRIVLGFPLGVFLSYGITVMISLITKDGNYYPVVPAFALSAGTEMRAVLLQFIFSGLMGAGFGAGSLVWEAEDWSILKQSLAHFAIISVSTLPVAYLLHWMGHSVVGVTTYFLFFIGFYVVIWFILYTTWKKRIQAINAKLREEAGNS